MPVKQVKPSFSIRSGGSGRLLLPCDASDILCYKPDNE